ncbi:helix-turn-helix transcriptional regulator [Arthrobacter sp. UC242_113]|uniref:helix-turn-helix transcriptional regulator n=1 Tax=Arthrobacter sp. UC242_113 TaxID=3374550 RepID=UPI0037572E09
MDNRTEIRDFLASRRARITPDRAGLPDYGGNRRVPGLRRGEVASLAGVSIEYYTRLERGNLGGASDDVLEAVARALQLDEAEREHLFDLAHAASAGGKARRRPARKQSVRPSLQAILHGMTGSPAFVRNGRLDILAINDLGRALYSEAFGGAEQQVNLARFCFLDPRARTFYPAWEDAANTTVALLRTEAGRDPYDKALQDLIGELSTRSDEFRVRWAAHNVRLHRTGLKHFHHPVVGTLALAFDAMDLPADPGLTLTAYSAQPGSAEEDALKLLASWAASQEQPAAGSSRQAAPEPKAANG